MAARAPAGGEHGGAAAEGEAKLASAKTRSDYEHAVKRLEGMNLNLKLRVAQLEEELEHDSTAGADASAQPSMYHGPTAEASAQPSTTASTLGEDAASARVSADLEKRREALDGEWEAVQKLHEEVAALKMDLEMGKLPAEPAVRRKAFLAKHTALQDKVGLLESEMRGLRQNCKEARRLQEHAEARALDAAKELDAARQHAKGLEDAVEGLTKRAADAEAELAAATAAEVVAVAGVNGGLSEEGAGGGQVVMYLEKVLSLEQRLAEQAEIVRQQQRREDALASRARQLERELAKREASGTGGKVGRGVGVSVMGDCHAAAGAAGGEDGQHGVEKLEGKLAKKRVQVVKWKQQAVRCEEARGALEAEVVHVRSLLLEEQRLRAQAQASETGERRQLAFSQKRIVRLEAELRTANDDKHALQHQIAGMKQHLDHMTVCHPENSEPPSSIGEPSTRSCAQHAATQTAAEGWWGHAEAARWPAAVSPMYGGVARKDVDLSGASPTKSPLKVKRRLEVVVEGDGDGSDARAATRREGIRQGEEGRRSSSSSPSKSARGAVARRGRGRSGGAGIESLATRVSMALIHSETGVGEGSPNPYLQEQHMHEQRRLQQQLRAVEMEVEALRAEAGELASRLLLSDQALQETRQELQASKARLARARQQNAANKLSLQMWDSLRSGEGEGEGQQGRGANVSEARDPEANEAFVRMRRRVGELEIECSQYQERLAAANVLLRACTCHGGADGGTERHKAYADHDDSRQRKMDELRRSVRRHKEQLQQRDSLVDWVDQTCNHLLLHMQASDDGEMPRLGARGDTSGGLTSSPLHSTPSRKTAGWRARRGGGNGALQQRAQLFQAAGHHVILPSASRVSSSGLGQEGNDGRALEASPGDRQQDQLGEESSFDQLAQGVKRRLTQVVEMVELKGGWGGLWVQVRGLDDALSNFQERITLRVKDTEDRLGKCEGRVAVLRQQAMTAYLKHAPGSPVDVSGAELGGAPAVPARRRKQAALPAQAPAQVPACLLAAALGVQPGVTSPLSPQRIIHDDMLASPGAPRDQMLEVRSPTSPKTAVRLVMRQGSPPKSALSREGADVANRSEGKRDGWMQGMTAPEYSAAAVDGRAAGGGQKKSVRELFTQLRHQKLRASTLTRASSLPLPGPTSVSPVQEGQEEDCNTDEDEDEEETGIAPFGEPPVFSSSPSRAAHQRPAESPAKAGAVSRASPSPVKSSNASSPSRSRSKSAQELAAVGPGSGGRGRLGSEGDSETSGGAYADDFEDIEEDIDAEEAEEGRGAAAGEDGSGVAHLPATVRRSPDKLPSPHVASSSPPRSAGGGGQGAGTGVVFVTTPPGRAERRITGGQASGGDTRGRDLQNSWSSDGSTPECSPRAPRGATHFLCTTTGAAVPSPARGVRSPGRAGGRAESSADVVKGGMISDMSHELSQALLHSSESDKSEDSDTSLDSEGVGASRPGSRIKGSAADRGIGGDLRHSALGGSAKHASLASLKRQMVSQQFR